MEQVYVIAVKSFVNGIAGSVTKKQKLLLPKNIATEFEAMGLVVYEAGKLVPTPEPTETTQGSETDVGTEEQSASLPVETASQTTTLPTSRRGRRGAR